jgi:hypothetical protein
MNRWWIYQKERFPLVAHAPLIAAFSASAVCYSTLLRGNVAHPAWDSLAVAFLVSLGSFLLLRIADEFKDAEEDARYRPYRPVPRGLVKLSELGWIGIGVAAVQLLLVVGLCLGRAGESVVFRWQLPALLAVTWVYFGLMSKEFFARDWLKARPVVYLLSHMMIMPLVDWFATGCDWVPFGAHMPAGLFWFLAASFCNGVVIELGRKIRAPSQEETGVETYSFLWGRPMAVAAWLGAMGATLVCALVAADKIGFLPPVGIALAGVWLMAAGLGWRFVKTENGRLAKGIEATAGVWTLTLYLMLGVIPLFFK